MHDVDEIIDASDARTRYGIDICMVSNELASRVLLAISHQLAREYKVGITDVGSAVVNIAVRRRDIDQVACRPLTKPWQGRIEQATSFLPVGRRRVHS